MPVWQNNGHDVVYPQSAAGSGHLIVDRDATGVAGRFGHGSSGDDPTPLEKLVEAQQAHQVREARRSELLRNRAAVVVPIPDGDEALHS